MTTVYVVVPDGIDDPAQPSGGNAYDRRICSGLAAIGWSVRERAAPGSWPRPDAMASAALAGLVADIPDGALVLVDGLIASSTPEVLVPEAHRLRLVVLVHMPFGDNFPRERAVLSAADMVITTSSWTRDWLLERYRLTQSRVCVAEPGVDSADLATGTATGGELLCVAAVTPDKGHEVLLATLAAVSDLRWHCVCVGSLTRDPSYADQIRRQASKGGVLDRVHFAGPLSGAHLDAAYDAADVLVFPTRAETYGMVVTEALARGLPVIATAVGGLPEALGDGADGRLPGILVQPGDSAAFAAALRAWLVDADLRAQLRRAARERRASLSDWSTTTARISQVLTEAAA